MAESLQGNGLSLAIKSITTEKETLVKLKTETFTSFQQQL